MKSRTAVLPKCWPSPTRSSLVFLGGACKIRIRGFRLANLASRIASSSSVYLPGDLDGLPVEIVKAILAAEISDVRFGFMIARNDVHSIGALLHDRAEHVQAAPPIPQVTG